MPVFRLIRDLFGKKDSADRMEEVGLEDLSALLDQTFATHARPMPAGLNSAYFLLNLGCGFILISIMLHYFVTDRESAYAKQQQSETHIRELMLTDPLTDVAP